MLVLPSLGSSCEGVAELHFRGVHGLHLAACGWLSEYYRPGRQTFGRSARKNRWNVRRSCIAPAGTLD